jgi:uncharacterized protein involved in exopolysaccharide biosynthesis
MTTDNAAERPSLLRFLVLLLDGRRMLVVWTAAGMLVGGLFATVRPSSFTSQVTFMPQTTSPDLGGLGGLAAQLGVRTVEGDVTQSPQFYVDLLESDGVLSTIVQRDFVVEGAASTLVALYGLDRVDEGERRRQAVQMLRDQLRVQLRPETGVVTAAMTSRWSPLPRQVLDALTQFLNGFNQEVRQSRAAAERRFIEGRLRQAADSLRAAESALEAFLQSNRTFQDSPRLSFDHDRLERQVALRQQVVASLTESYERSRIDEVRNTPVITVIAPAADPLAPDPRHRMLTVFLGGVFGSLTGILLLLAAAFLRNARTAEPDTFNEFLRARRAAFRGLAGWLRPGARQAGALRDRPPGRLESDRP